MSNRLLAVMIKRDSGGVFRERPTKTEGLLT